MSEPHWLTTWRPHAVHRSLAIMTRRTTPSPLLIPPDSELAESPFVAMDFETANRLSGVSACQIALVRVVDGVVTDELDTLIKPPSEWDHFEFTYLHGIGPDEVRDAPSWPAIADQVRDFVADVPVYAHNAAFDRGVWAQLDEFFNTSTLPRRFYCSYRTAKRMVPGLPNYKLPTVVHACNPSFDLDHHHAGSDAQACAQIVIALQQMSSKAL